MSLGEAHAASINQPERNTPQPRPYQFCLKQNSPEALMLNRDHFPRAQNAQKPLVSISAMAYAQNLAAEYKELETNYHNGRYKFTGKALISYRKFLSDPVGYRELLNQDNIAGLREKPDLKTTSRLVLYFLTNAQSEAERNTAGKYARIVDYLHKEHVANAAAADHVRNAGGIEKILKKAQGCEALKAADRARRAGNWTFDQGESDETNTSTSRDVTDELFDPEQDASLRLGSEVLAQVLSAEIPMNEVFYLECRKTGSIGRNGIRIVGRLWDSESE
jgi:hypothetical protein